MITIKTFPFNPFQVNTYVLSDETQEAIVIDPACYTGDEKTAILNYIEENNLKIRHLINTHCHVDHIVGAPFIKENFSVDFKANEADKELLEGAIEHGKIFGFELESVPDIEVNLDEGDVVEFGKSKLDIFSVPGHSPGSLAFYSKTDGFVIVGDALFLGSIGRTDLPGGDYNQLISSIKVKLLTLPDDTKVFPGHGPSTTVKNEHDTNPFLT